MNDFSNRGNVTYDEADRIKWSPDSKAFLLHYVALYGLPSACTSDQGSNFVSQLFTEMQKNLGIKISHTPIYWPQGNGLLERNHQSLKNSIRAQLVEMGEIYQQNWMKYLPWALLGRRTAFNKDLAPLAVN